MDQTKKHPTPDRQQQLNSLNLQLRWYACLLLPMLPQPTLEKISTYPTGGILNIDRQAIENAILIPLLKITSVDGNDPKNFSKASVVIKLVKMTGGRLKVSNFIAVEFWIVRVTWGKEINQIVALGGPRPPTSTYIEQLNELSRWMSSALSVTDELRPTRNRVAFNTVIL